MKNYDLNKILDLHQKWLNGEDAGERANLSYANLRSADLIGADLSRADLSRADLSGADLSRADLSRADLIGADLRDATLRSADLCDANLCSADLCDANLCDATLRSAKNIDTVKYNEKTAFFAMQCPESGSYTAYKKAHNLIVELEIPADAMRSSATSRKCRASKAKVISITDMDGEPAGTQVASDHDKNFLYVVGQTVEVPDFDTDRWKECSSGIHHFITRSKAVNYNR